MNQKTGARVEGSARAHLAKTPMLRPAVLLILPLLAAAPLAAQDLPSDRSRRSVEVTIPPDATLDRPTVVALPDLLALPSPPGVVKNDPRYRDVRIPSFPNSLNLSEGEIIQTTGWIHVVGRVGDSYVIQLGRSPTSGGACLVAAVPDPDRLEGLPMTMGAVPRQRPVIAGSMKLIPLLRDVRKTIKGALLHGRDPDPQGSVIKPAHATITGQLFFDDSRVGGAHEGLRQCQSPGLWEVRPMTLLKLDPPG